MKSRAKFKHVSSSFSLILFFLNIDKMKKFLLYKRRLPLLPGGVFNRRSSRVDLFSLRQSSNLVGAKEEINICSQSRIIKPQKYHVWVIERLKNHNHSDVYNSIVEFGRFTHHPLSTSRTPYVDLICYYLKAFGFFDME